MASGYGLHGGVSRCFPFWQDFLSCYVIHTADDKDERWRCIPQRDDYYECLYHKKEKAKVRMVRAAYLRRLEQGGAVKPGMPDVSRAGEPKSLGVLDKK